MIGRKIFRKFLDKSTCTLPCKLKHIHHNRSYSRQNMHIHSSWDLLLLKK